MKPTSKNNKAATKANLLKKTKITKTNNEKIKMNIMDKYKPPTNWQKLFTLFRHFNLQIRIQKQIIY